MDLCSSSSSLIYIFLEVYFIIHILYIIGWLIGLILYFFMILIAFLGYSLPYGQMSYWGATVITNFLSVIPYIGEDIKKYIWGEYKIGSSTILRFYVIHYTLPFILILFILFHIYFIHKKGGNNPIAFKEIQIKFSTYYIHKDFFSFFLLLLFFFFFLFYFPNFLGHVDNYIEANPYITPSHIVTWIIFITLLCYIKKYT